MSWDRKQGTKGLTALLFATEPCPSPFDRDKPVHWGGVPWAGDPPGVSCFFCHKTWWLRDGGYVPTSAEIGNA